MSLDLNPEQGKNVSEDSQLSVTRQREIKARGPPGSVLSSWAPGPSATTMSLNPESLWTKVTCGPHAFYAIAERNPAVALELTPEEGCAPFTRRSRKSSSTDWQWRHGQVMLALQTGAQTRRAELWRHSGSALHVANPQRSRSTDQIQNRPPHTADAGALSLNPPGQSQMGRCGGNVATWWQRGNVVATWQRGNVVATWQQHRATSYEETTDAHDFGSVEEGHEWLDAADRIMTGLAEASKVKAVVLVVQSLPAVARLSVQACHPGTATISDEVRQVVAFMRIWCLVELMAARDKHKPVVMFCGSAERDASSSGFLFVDDFAALTRLKWLVDVTTAEAAGPRDKARILGQVSKVEGGAADLNADVSGWVSGSPPYGGGISGLRTLLLRTLLYVVKPVRTLRPSMAAAFRGCVHFSCVHFCMLSGVPSFIALSASSTDE